MNIWKMNTDLVLFANSAEKVIFSTQSRTTCDVAAKFPHMFSKIILKTEMKEEGKGGRERVYFSSP